MPRKINTTSDKENNKLISITNNFSETEKPTPFKLETVHYNATYSQVLSADVILIVLLVITVYVCSSHFISAIFHLRENVKNIYEGFKTGKFHYDCTFGGSAIQIAECQIFHGFNVFLFYTVTYFLEYTSLIFRGSNIVEVVGRVAGLFCMLKLLISSIPFSFLFNLIHSGLFLLRQIIILAIVRFTCCK